MRRRASGFVLMLALGCSLTVGTPPTPAPTPATRSPAAQAPSRLTGDIVFVSDRGGASQLYGMPASGGRARQITFDVAQHLFPDWSPDGLSLAYTLVPGPQATVDIHVLSDAGGDRALTDDSAFDGSPAWSPDGMRLAFESAPIGQPGIVALDEDGDRATRSLLTGGASPAYQPSWSPDGRLIAFALREAGCIEADLLCEQHVWVMTPAGRRMTQLTADDEHDGEPAWSPDGTMIAFSTNRAGGNFDIWVMRADGSHLRRLTSAEGTDINPEWSPDGRMIAFTSARDGNLEIYVMTPDGAAQTNLTNAAGDDFSPTWR
jgi:Tol biopolymer transport system component